MNLYFKKLSNNGKPLLVLHGLFGSGDNWLSHGRQWAEEYQVYLIDQRNHGHSPHSSDMDYELMSEDLFSFLATEDLRDILIIGHSMGGKTAMRFAQKYDFLIDKMIIVDMGIKKYKPHHEDIFKGLLKADVQNRKSRKEVEDILLPYIPEESTRQFLMKNLYWKVPGKELAWRFNLPILYENREQLVGALPEEKIATDTLFLIGGKSNYVPATDYNVMKELVPNSQFEVIENAGHWLHAEQPDLFASAVKHFFSL